MTPKIIFRYSWVYDQLRREKWKKNSKYYPSPKEILNYMEKANKFWKKDGMKILKEISKITNLKWEEKEMHCYVVGRGIAFSDPLTVTIFENDLKSFRDMLTHELIHRIFSQRCNLKKFEKYLNFSRKKYKGKNHTTIIHIPLFAVHSHVYYKFYREERLKKDIKFHKRLKLKEHIKAWDIVQKEGYQNIISEFRKRIK